MRDAGLPHRAVLADGLGATSLMWGGIA
jgi:hypothetical protein